MSDLISRQAAIDAIRKCSVREVTPAYMLIDKAEVMTELMLLPSAQPKIIRCKDCKHYNAGFECLIEGYGIERDKDWFCADAERREEE